MKVLRQTLALSFVLLLVCAPLGGYAQARRRVSLVLTNGKIFTADARGTIAQAVAVDGEHIVA